MNGLVIFIIVVVISAVIGGITQLLKKAQQAEQERLAQRRASSRRSGGDRPPAGDIDRFLEEIDKLRRKGGVEPPVARPTAVPIPTVAPSVPPRFADSGFATPPQAPRVMPRLEDLPVAVPAPQRATPVVARRAAPAGPRKPQPTTEFGRQFFGMMGSKQTIAMAVVLQEVLGPPKCKRQ